MPHKPLWAMLAIVTLFTLAADSSAQETLQPYAPSILHTFLDSANVYPESVTVDQSSGTFFVGSVKEGTIYKGKIARPGLEVFSPGGADGRSIATGMFFANNGLVVVGRQTGLIFVYNTQNGRLISKLEIGLRTGQTFLNDTTFAPDGSAYVTDSINPVLYRLAPTKTGQYELQEFLKFEGTPVTYVNAPGAEGIQCQRHCCNVGSAISSSASAMRTCSFGWTSSPERSSLSTCRLEC